LEVAELMENNKFIILCPCCEANLTIDAQTGAILAHEEKKKPLASFEEMAKDLERQKEARENIFAQEMNAQKDRERLLEEKFQEAFKRADKDAAPYRNPLDFD
jgi:ribosome-associated translation inhibitor RaiA